VKAFRETRPDQIDPDFFKNKVKMTTINKMKKAQEEHQKNIYSTVEKEIKIENPKRFLRTPNKFTRKFVRTSSKIMGGSMFNEDSC
jgi:predicted RND superfamily exporter protein